MYESIYLYGECDGQSVPDIDQYLNANGSMQWQCVQLYTHQSCGRHRLQLDTGRNCRYQQCFGQRNW